MACGDASAARADGGLHTDTSTTGKEKSLRVRPGPEPVRATVFEDKRDEQGMPRLSYPGRAPVSVDQDPGYRPMSHGTMLIITGLASATLWTAASAIVALPLCDDWSHWMQDIFRRNVCGFAPIAIGSLALWFTATVAVSNVHGANYDGTRAEAVGLVGLGTLLGIGAAAMVWAATENRFLVGASTLLFPFAGALGFGEYAAHMDDDDAAPAAAASAPKPFPLRVGASPSGVQASIAVVF